MAEAKTTEETKTPAFRRYLEMTQRSLQIRVSHQGEDSPEEDALLDEMDGIWWSMTDEEQGFAEFAVVPPHGEAARLLRDKVAPEDLVLMDDINRLSDELRLQDAKKKG